MNGRMFASLTLSAVLLSGATAVTAQNPAKVQSDASPSQRVEVLRSRLEQMRRSLNSAVAAVNSDDSGKKEKDADDPRKRLAGLEKEAASILSEVSDIRGKIDRAERYEAEKIAGLETSTADLQARVDSAMQATAGARNASANTVASSSKSKKKRGKLFGLLGGGGGDDKYAELTGTVAAGRDKVLFEDAAHEVRKSNHEVGRLLFNTIITTYPDSAYLPLAKLAIADSFYLEGTTSSLIQAASAYNDWLTFFPTDPLADRVMLKMAECEMRQMGLPDREITKARKAEQRLKVLLQQFPDTALKTDVDARLNEVQENLGMHSLMVARFYDDRQKNHHGGLKGAQSRLQEILEKYPNFSHNAEVNFRLGATYVLEEEPDEAAKYFQAVVRDHPNSEFAEKAKEQLQLIGAPIPEPDPIKAEQPEPEAPSFTQRILTEVTGSVDVTVDKSGVLISKDKDNEGKDLIDQAIANQGQITPSSVPVAPINRRPPAKSVVPTPVPAASSSSSVGAQTQPASTGGSPKP